jgi:hypothetical protein
MSRLAARTIKGGKNMIVNEMNDYVHSSENGFSPMEDFRMTYNDSDLENGSNTMENFGMNENGNTTTNHGNEVELFSTTADSDSMVNSSNIAVLTPPEDLNYLIENATSDAPVQGAEVEQADPDLTQDRAARKEYLNQKAQDFQNLDVNGYGIDDLKGQILLEAWQRLKTDDSFWTKWVKKTLMTPLRTAQRLRDVHSFYWAERPADVPSVALEYRAKVGITKLDLIRTLWNADPEERTAAGVTTLTITEESIRITLTKTSDTGEQVPVEYDASSPDLTVRKLRSSMPARATRPPRQDESPAPASDEESQTAMLLSRIEELEKEKANLESYLQEAQGVLIQVSTERDTWLKKYYELQEERELFKVA